MRLHRPGCRSIIQYIPTGRSGPFGGNGNIPEDEGLDTIGRLEPEALDANSCHDGFEKVVNQCRKGEEHSVFSHE